MRCWPGVRQARRALGFADPRAESLAESLGGACWPRPGSPTSTSNGRSLSMVSAIGWICGWGVTWSRSMAWRIPAPSRRVGSLTGRRAGAPRRAAAPGSHLRAGARDVARGLGRPHRAGRQDAMVRVRAEEAVTRARFGPCCRLTGRAGARIRAHSADRGLFVDPTCNALLVAAYVRSGARAAAITPRYMWRPQAAASGAVPGGRREAGGGGGGGGGAGGRRSPRGAGARRRGRRAGRSRRPRWAAGTPAASPGRTGRPPAGLVM